MKALVAMKRCIDYSVKIRVKKNNTAVQTENVTFSTNPFCQIALQEAVQQKQKKKIQQITVVTIGPKKHFQTLLNGLAIGADKGIHILTDLRTDQQIHPLTVAQVLKNIIQKNNYDIVFLGKQCKQKQSAIDDDCNQTGQLLAGILNWPQATFCSKIQIDQKNKKANVLREIDNGLQLIQVELPSIITCDLRLNTPRIANIINLKKAKSKPVEQLKLQQMGVNMQTGIIVEKVQLPEIRSGGKILQNVDQLIRVLKKQQKVL